MNVINVISKQQPEVIWTLISMLYIKGLRIIYVTIVTSKQLISAILDSI